MLSLMTSYTIQGPIMESTDSAYFTQHQQITNNTDIYFTNLKKNILQVTLHNVSYGTQYYYPVLIC